MGDTKHQVWGRVGQGTQGTLHTGGTVYINPVRVTTSTKGHVRHRAQSDPRLAPIATRLLHAGDIGQALLSLSLLPLVRCSQHNTWHSLGVVTVSLVPGPWTLAHADGSKCRLLFPWPWLLMRQFIVKVDNESSKLKRGKKFSPKLASPECFLLIHPIFF